MTTSTSRVDVRCEWVGRGKARRMELVTFEHTFGTDAEDIILDRQVVTGTAELRAAEKRARDLYGACI